MIERQLKKYRQICGMSQKSLADRLGKSRQKISRWETGSEVPNENEIAEIAMVLGISPEKLLQEQEEKPEPALSSEEEKLLAMLRGVEKASDDVQTMKSKLSEQETARIQKIELIRKERRNLRITVIVGGILLLFLAMYLFCKRWGILDPNGIIEGPAILENETGYIVDGTGKAELGG
jgi:Predicted transcriptional regulators